MSARRRRRTLSSKSAGEVHESLAFVARVVDYKESDRIVTLITEKLGKLGALARGARKSRRRFGAALSPYLLGTCTLAGHPSEGRLLTLSSYAVAESFPQLARHIERVSLAAYFTELVRETTAEAQPEPKIFALLLSAHRLLDADPPGSGLVRGFELQLLRHLGLEPRLDRCMGLITGESCGRPVPSPSAGDSKERIYGFDASKGGVLCPRCASRPFTGPPGVSGGGRPTAEQPEPVRLSEEALAAMRDLKGVSLKEIAAVRPDLDAKINRQIRSATQAKFATLVKGELKTVRFIRELKRTGKK